MGQGSSEKGNGCNRATPRGHSDEELAAAIDVFSSLLLLLTNWGGTVPATRKTPSIGEKETPSTSWRKE